MYKAFIKTILLLLVCCNMAFSQSPSNPYWKKYRLEAYFGFGPSSFAGDLGGGVGEGTHYFRDIDLRSTRFATHIGARYKLLPRLAIRSDLSFLRCFGDDRITENFYRNYRNLKFRTNIFEFAVMGEYALYKEQMGHRYKLNGVIGRKLYQIHAYVFGGVALFYFNPQGFYKDQWYDLRPLGTEGQGIYPTRPTYGNVQLSLPVGIGFRYNMSYRLAIFGEFSFRKTFTDYIDDVSTSYADKDKLREKHGQLAVELADPSVGAYPDVTKTGEQRGNPNNTDAYMFATFGVSVKLKTTKKGYYIPLF